MSHSHGEYGQWGKLIQFVAEDLLDQGMSVSPSCNHSKHVSLDTSSLRAERCFPMRKSLTLKTGVVTVPR